MPEVRTEDQRGGAGPDRGAVQEPEEQGLRRGSRGQLEDHGAAAGEHDQVESEALARMHCQDEVAPKHARRAYRLLKKSIIRVEQPDVALEETDERGGGHGGRPGRTHGGR